MEAQLGTAFYYRTDMFNMIEATANHGSEFIENEPIYSSEKPKSADWARIAS